MVDKKLVSRKDFLWGVCVHTPGFGGPYKESNLEDIVLAAAKMGCKLIRMDTGGTTLSHLDKAVKLANAYGMKVMLIVGILGFERRITNKVGYTAPLTEHFKLFAERYNGQNGCGKIDFIQIHNEMDIYIHLAMNFGDKPIPDGESIEEWNTDYLSNVAIHVKAAIDGVKQSETDIKTVINFSWKHYGMLKFFRDYGIEWDITGHDWYNDMMDAVEREGLTPYGVAQTIYKEFGKPILICESNVWRNEPIDIENMEIYDTLIRCMEDAYSKDYVIGYTFYEICDQLGRDYGKPWDREAHFGLLTNTVDGTLTGEKPIYRRISAIIGGNSQIPKVDWDVLAEKEKCNLHIPLYE